MREIDSKKIFQKVRALVKFSPKSICNEPFHRNLIGFGKLYSFESNGPIEKIHIGFKSY